MFVKYNSNFINRISFLRFPKTRRPSAGRARMLRYMRRWQDEGDGVKEERRSEDEMKVSSEHAFVVADGRTIRSIAELKEALESMEEHHFNHHTKEHGNDFASWMRDVWKEEAAADFIERCQSREEAIEIVNRLYQRHAR